MGRSAKTRFGVSAVREIAQLPGPRGLPLIGNGLQLLPMSARHLRIEAWCERYGPIFAFRAAGKRWVALADQDEINVLLRDRPNGFRRLREMEKAFEEPGFAGVFSVEGEPWKRQRGLVVRALNANHLHRRYDVIQTATQRLQQRLRERASTGESFAITRLFTSFSVDVASTLAFGHDLNTLERGEVELQVHIERVTGMIAFRSVFPFAYWRFFALPVDRAYRRSVMALRVAIAGFIEQARTQLRERPRLWQEPENLLQAMLVAQEQDNTFTDAEIVGNVYTLLLAGEDTTAHTLAWTIALLAERPDIQARLAQEAVAVLGQAPFPADHEAVARLPYCEAVLRESMRLKPVSVMDSYEPLADTTICGTRIPAETRVLLLKRHVSRSDGGPDFDPDRWLDHDERDSPDQKSFLNFGAGPRFCPGRNLAFLEAKSALAMIARDFEIELDESAGPVREHFGFTMVPTGLRVRLRERRVQERTFMREAVAADGAVAGCPVMAVGEDGPSRPRAVVSDGE
jgi:cytochrome P450